MQFIGSIKMLLKMLIKMLISVGTSYEAANLRSLLAPDSCEDIMGDELIDVRRITTGHHGNIPITILEPTFRGPMPQYAAMRETLNRCPKAQQFYKTGGMAGAYDHGDIIIAAEENQNELFLHFPCMQSQNENCALFPIDTNR